MTHRVIPLLATFLLADASIPPQTVSPIGRPTKQTVKIEGCHGQPGCTAVDINGSISASTSGKATAAAPTYVEGTDNPLSIDLSGNIRTLATLSGASSFSDGSVDRQARVFDADTGGGTHWTAEMILMTPGSGGPTQTGTSANPLFVTPRGFGNNWNIDAFNNGHVQIQNGSDALTLALPNAQTTSAATGLMALIASYNSTLPTLTSGKMNYLQVDSRGRTIITGDSGAAAVPVSGTFWQATQPISGTAAVTQSTSPWVVDGSAVTQPVSGTFWQATQPVSGTVTANQGGTWTVQPGNTANTTAWKVDGSAVTQPVSGTFWQATQPVSGTFWQATQPVSGTFWQATQPVSGTVAATQSGTWTVQPGNTQNTTPWLIAPQDPADTVGSLTTNASTSIVTLGHGEGECGLTISGTWTTTTSIQFESSKDGSTYALTSYWGLATGKYFVLATANADWIAPASGLKSLRVRVNGGTWTGTANVNWHCTLSTQPPPAIGLTGTQNGANPSTSITRGDASTALVAAVGDPEGRLLTRGFGSNPFQCQLAGSTATTTQCQAAPAAGLKLYVTDVVLSSGGAAQTVAIKYGTGSNCATGATNMTAAIHLPNTGAVPMHFVTPYVAAAANAVCCTSAAAIAYTCNITGYTAP